MLGVLKQTDRQGGRVNMFDEALVGAIQLHDEDNQQRHQMCPAVQIDNEGFVGAVEPVTEQVVYLPFGGNAVGMFEETESEYVFNGYS